MFSYLYDLNFLSRVYLLLLRYDAEFYDSSVYIACLAFCVVDINMSPKACLSILMTSHMYLIEHLNERGRIYSKLYNDLPQCLQLLKFLNKKL